MIKHLNNNNNNKGLTEEQPFVYIFLAPSNKIPNEKDSFLK